MKLVNAVWFVPCFAVSSVLATITFSSGTSSADASAFNSAMTTLANSGDTGQSLANFIFASSTSVTVVITSDPAQTTSTTPNSDGSYTVIFSTATGALNYVDPASLSGIPNPDSGNETPPSPEVVIGHEFAHVYIDTTEVSGGGSNSIERESNDVVNYENPIREDLGFSDRTSYSGAGLATNTTDWQYYAANLFNDFYNGGED